jgi:myo-inositol-1(or 4)-monophosphatase
VSAININQRFEFAQNLIGEAGELAMGYFRDLASLDIQSKGLQDMASQADIETEELIRDKIKQAFPEDAFFGEETGGVNPDADQGMWVVDPIDGTACFVAGIAMWCVSIAFVVNERIEFGLIYAPALDELFTAVRGQGAHLNGKPISPSATSSLTDGRMCIGFSHRSNADQVVPVFDALIKAGGMYVCYGTGALGLAYVACGRLIGYYEPHINSWDCYGAVAILREAGADVCDAEANDGLTKGCEIITTAPGVTTEFAELLSSAIPKPQSS